MFYFNTIGDVKDVRVCSFVTMELMSFIAASEMFNILSLKVKILPSLLCALLVGFLLGKTKHIVKFRCVFPNKLPR